MRILQLALKDLLQIWRDKKSLIFLLVMPAAFTFFMGFAFRSGESAEQTPTFRLGWLDQSNGPVSQQLTADLASQPAIEMVELAESDPAYLEEQVRSGKLDGAMVIPAGFDEATRTETAVQLTLVTDEATQAGQALVGMVRPAVVRSLSSAAMARLTVDWLIASGETVDTEAETARALEAAAVAWQEPAYVFETEMSGGSTQEEGASNPFTHTSPGMIVQFTLFGLVNSANILVFERRSRTLQRLLTTSFSRSGVIAGHMLAMFSVVMVQQIILVLFGQFALGVDYLRQPVATLILIVALALWTTCLGLLISVSAKGEEQVILFSLLAMFLFSALGGAWFPLEGSGSTFATIGHFTPSAWAMDGFHNILSRGMDVSGAVTPALVQVGYAVVFFAAAVFVFSRKQEA